MAKKLVKQKGKFHKFFIPHAGNNYHPHILHTKRALAYSGLFLALKMFIVGFAVLLPVESFLSPDVLAEQGRKIVALVNGVRKDNGLPSLLPNTKLTSSAQTRVDDMVTLQYFSHIGPDGHTLKYFLNQVGYNYSTAGENLAMGFSDAGDVVTAWSNSPTHYANMINKDYTQEGLGMVAGNFNGTPTVFVAQHFGFPQTEAASSQSALPIKAKPPANDGQHTMDHGQATTNAKPPVTQPMVTPPTVIGTEVVSAPSVPNPSTLTPNPSPSISIDPANSSVSWKEVDGHTEVAAQVTVSGSAAAASVEVNGFPVPLKQTTTGVFTGAATIPDAPKDIFKVVTDPSVMVTGENGVSEQGTVAWKDPKIVSQTPWQRYVQANSWLGKSIPLFDILRWFYIFALAFFVIALAIHLYVEETRKYAKKHFIWLQTLGMIAILAVMIRY